MVNQYEDPNNADVINKEKENNVQKSRFEAGDIVLTKGFDIPGRLVRFLIGVRYGTPIKHSFSHLVSMLDDRKCIGAETTGVKELNVFDEYKDYEVVAYRFNEIDNEQKQELNRYFRHKLGIPYAFSRYFLDAVRLIAFFYGVFALGRTLFDLSWWGLSNLLSLFTTIEPYRFKQVLIHLLVAGSVFLILTLLMRWLYKEDLATHDCSEFQSLGYAHIGMYVPLVKARNDFPNGIKQNFDNLVLHGVCKVVVRKSRDGAWEWEL